MINKIKLVPLIFLLLAFGSAALARQPGENAASAGHELHVDPVDLSSFADGLFKAQMRAFHIPGATFSVVAGGRLILSKGYGRADLAGNRPVDPGRTLFRVGSVSKLVVWTAVMQLAERGLIDLDADVNRYLDGFAIPPAFGKPVTMADLMAHTPGFEDRAMGIMKEKAEDMVPLERHLAEHLPARVFPPGEVTSYSNYGASLAGHIVGRVSGLGFDAYVRANIFEPLGMDHTTFQQPPPPDLASDLAVGYEYDQGRYLAKPFEYVQDAPAGAMSSTARDMAAFMLAHMNNGRLAGRRILEARTAERMHERLFGNENGLSGMAHGFYEADVAGRRMIMHEGDTLWFHTLLAMDPELDFGVFVSYNAPGGVRARRSLLKALAERFLPGMPPEAAPAPMAGLEPPLSDFAGWYALNRSSKTTLEKTMVMLNQRSVAPAGNGTLVTSGLFSDRAMRWVRSGPFSFTSVDGEDRLVFKPLPSGGMRMFLDSLPIMAFERQPWYAETVFSLVLVGACALVFLAGVAGWPVAALTGRSRTIFSRSRPAFKSGKIVAWTVCLLNLVFIALALALGTDPKLMYGVTGPVKKLLCLPLANALPTLLMGAACAWAWLKSYYTPAGRVFFTLAFAAAAAFTWFLYYWNLLGFNY